MGHNKIEHNDNELGSQKTTYDMCWILELAQQTKPTGTWWAFPAF